MVYAYLLLTFFLFHTNGTSLCHDFHVSKLDIRHNTKTDVVEMTLHVFIDDLESAMKQGGYMIQKLNSTENSPQIQIEISKYLNAKIKLSINQKPTLLTYLGQESAGESGAVFLYLDVKNVKDLHSLTLENRLMLESFSDQKNMVAIYQNKDLLDYIIFDHTETKREIRP